MLVILFSTTHSHIVKSQPTLYKTKKTDEKTAERKEQHSTVLYIIKDFAHVVLFVKWMHVPPQTKSLKHPF